MAGTALVVSIISFVAASAAAWYTRHTALTEQARLHRERQPRFRALFDVRDDPRGLPQRLEVVALSYLDGPGTLDSVVVTLVHRSEANNPPVMSIGGELEEPTGTVARLSTPMTLGQERIVRALRHVSEKGGLAPLQIDCTIGNERWVFLVECDVPPIRRPQVW